MHKKLLVTAYFVIAALLQTMTGNFPLSFFAFPLNVIVAVIWVYLLWRLYREGNKLPLTRFLLSSRTSILSILLLIGGSLVIGLFPQLSEAEAASISGVPASLGCYNFMTSWVFIAILFLLLSNLTMVVIHAFYHRVPEKKRFLLNHLGVWFALFAGFFGSSDVQTLRIPLYAGQPGREAYSMDGKAYYLDYELELYSFNTEYYPNGMPSRFAADVRIGEQRTALEVNHPHSYRLGEDIYLTGYDTRNVGNTRYCILQIVRQPWKYVMVTGILMMLAGAVLLFINGPKKAKS
ncbi:cytochrome c biogenesis protein ResB [Bacteroides fragilis]|uniref:cytochrome c biogenesis protein ResB n=1 Tax=Bacteroides TaxID=816 RepID=UPI0018991611|nr:MULTISPECIES: cytochrome c biogenesis protein ResB [Bacteroides]MCE8623066.1 cytochrome c biogenesis protein ResB [Bacteroides fragilis]MCE8699651.1 cytochrome c biogenesis protein ResB [Bacteroides fragilis]MCE8703377.1 cytochrome c biogenesis protein ResB [Bacteroides fragilis]MCE9324621.1 cytochrome c biogenesis protein ResB [Bacteroides fragilis]MCE9447132.1 cytochrome c biogenesis protein ResB [Bacteroides fragilis]